MRRRTFDALLAVGGLIVATVLVAAGGLLTWASTSSRTRSDPAQPPSRSSSRPGQRAAADPDVGPYIDQYAGQQLTTGAQAQAFADHYIAVHLEEIGGGRPTPS